LGEAAPLSPTSLTRLKAPWQLEYEAWKRRRLDDCEVVYVWADGLSVKAGLEDSKAALAACEELRDQFAQRYRQLAPQAVERLAADWERLVTFYQFPREHGRHLRTTHGVESPFAAVRLRTTAAKRFKKVASATAMLWKLLQVAEQTFRRLNAPELLPAVYAGAT
jgi:transposase-like protein